MKKEDPFDKERYAWATLYRPQTIDEMALAPSYREEFLMMEDMGYIANSIILHGTPGVGKTTIAEILGSLPSYSFHSYDAGKHNSKSHFQDIVKDITSAGLMSLFEGNTEKKRLIFLDEFNNINTATQQVLNKTMEETAAKNTFIFATNHLDSITPQLQNRCSLYRMNFSIIDDKTGKLEIFTKDHGMTKQDWIDELRRAALLVGKKTKVKVPNFVFQDVEQNVENLVSVRGYMRAVSHGCMKHYYELHKNKQK